MPYTNPLVMLIGFAPLLVSAALGLFLLYLAVRLVRALEAIAPALRDRDARMERLAAAVERLASPSVERNP